MKCDCCDRLLNNFESTRKSKLTGEYLNMCNKCYATIADDVSSTGRSDYDPDEFVENEDNGFDEVDTGEEYE